LFFENGTSASSASGGMNTVAVASDDERRAIEKLEATNAGAGLSSGEAAARLAALGPNRLVEERRITFLAILFGKKCASP